MFPSANNPTASDASRPATRSHEFVAALARAYTLSEIFPLHHPTVQDAVREVMERLPELEDTVVGVARSGFTQEGQPVDDPHGHVREFARDLSMAGVSELALIVPLEADQLQRLLMGLRVVTEDPSISLEDFLAREGGCAVQLGFHGSPSAAVESLVERTEWVPTESESAAETVAEESVAEVTDAEVSDVVESAEAQAEHVETEAIESSDSAEAPVLPEWSVEDEIEAEARFVGAAEDIDPPASDDAASDALVSDAVVSDLVEGPTDSIEEPEDSAPAPDWQSEVRSRLLMASAIETPEASEEVAASEYAEAIEQVEAIEPTDVAEGASENEEIRLTEPFEAEEYVADVYEEPHAEFEATVPSIDVPVLELPVADELPDVEDELAATMDPAPFEVSDPFGVPEASETDLAEHDIAEHEVAEPAPNLAELTESHVVEFPPTGEDPEWAHSELYDEVTEELVESEPLDGSLDDEQSFALASQWGADIDPAAVESDSDSAADAAAPTQDELVETAALAVSEESWAPESESADAAPEWDGSHPIADDEDSPEFGVPFVAVPSSGSVEPQPLVPTLDDSEIDVPAAAVPPDTHLAAADGSMAPTEVPVPSAPAAQFEQVQAFRAALRDGSEAEAEVEAEPEPIEDLWEPDGESALATLWDAEAASWVDGSSAATDVEAEGEETYPAIEELAPDGPALVDPETEALENELAAEAASDLPYLSFPENGETPSVPATEAPSKSASGTAAVETAATQTAAEASSLDAPVDGGLAADGAVDGDAGPDFASLAASFLSAQEVERPALRRRVEDQAAALVARGSHEVIATGVEALVRDAVPGDIPAIELGRSLASDDVQGVLCSRLADVRDPDRRDELVYVFSQLSSIMAARLAHELSEVPPRAARRNYMDALFRMRIDAVTAAIPMLDDSRWFIVRNGVDVLGEAGDERSVAKLAPSLAHPDHRVRRATVMALAKLGGDRAGIELIPVLEDPSAEVREGAAMALGHLRVAKAQRPLLALLDRDKDDEAQMVILRSLGQLGDPGAVPAIEKRAVGFFFKKPSKAVRIAAYRALAAIGSPHARRLVSDAVADRDAEVSTAARALAAQFMEATNGAPEPAGATR